MNFTWKILEIFADCKKVKYFISCTDGTNTVEHEGYHLFSDKIVSKPFENIKEADVIAWIQADTSKIDVNAIKLNLENQLKTLENDQKLEFPWEANTFTVE